MPRVGAIDTGIPILQVAANLSCGSAGSSTIGILACLHWAHLYARDATLWRIGEAIQGEHVELLRAIVRKVVEHTMFQNGAYLHREKGEMNSDLESWTFQREGETHVPYTNLGVNIVMYIFNTFEEMP